MQVKVTVGALGAIDSARDGTGLEALPIACTLEAGDLKERVASIRELARDALTGFEREGTILALVPHISGGASARDGQPGRALLCVPAFLCPGNA